MDATGQRIRILMDLDAIADPEGHSPIAAAGKCQLSGGVGQKPIHEVTYCGPRLLANGQAIFQLT